MPRMGIRTLFLVSALFVSQSAYAAEVTIEDDALIAGDDVMRTVSLTIARVVQRHGYTCDSVSSFRELFTAKGFYIRCNGFLKPYEVRVIPGEGYQVKPGAI